MNTTINVKKISKNLLLHKNRGTSTQGGILAGSQGDRLPQNLQTHTRFWQKSTLFWHECDFKVFPYFLSSEGILPINTICRKYFLVGGRNILALQVIKCHKKKFIVTERNLYSRSRVEISCHKKKFLVSERNFLSQQEISCLRKKFLVRGRNVLSQQESS